MSGDLGPDHKLLQYDPEAPPASIRRLREHLRRHRPGRRFGGAPPRRLRAEVKAAIHPDGALLIPSFAVERHRSFSPTSSS